MINAHCSCTWCIKRPFTFDPSLPLPSSALIPSPRPPQTPQPCVPVPNRPHLPVSGTLGRRLSSRSSAHSAARSEERAREVRRVQTAVDCVLTEQRADNSRPRPVPPCALPGSVCPAICPPLTVPCFRRSRFRLFPNVAPVCLYLPVTA